MLKIIKAFFQLLQLSSLRYVQPGKSVKVTPHFHENRTTTSFQGSYDNDKLNHPDVAATPTVINDTSRFVDSSVNNHTKYTSQTNESTKCVADTINVDDNDILKVI